MSKLKELLIEAKRRALLSLSNEAKAFVGMPSAFNNLKSLSLKEIGTMAIALSAIAGDRIDIGLSSRIKGDKGIRDFLKKLDKEASESILEEKILQCESGEKEPDLSEFNLKAEDFAKPTGIPSDLLQKIGSFSLSREIQNSFNSLKWKGAVSIAALLVVQVKELLEQSDWPSIWRLKFLQKEIRTFTALFEKIGEGVSDIKSGDKKKILAMLKGLDSILVAAGVASLVYFTNSKKAKKSFREAFNKQVSTSICETPPPPDEGPPPRKFTLSNELVCPPDLDNVIVPHNPIVEDLDLSCETPVVQEKGLSEGREPIFVKAIYEILSKKNFKIIPIRGDLVTPFNPIIFFDGKKIYSDFSARVLDVTENRVLLENLEPVDGTFIDELLKKQEKLYKRQNEASFFIKEFYIDALYPYMLYETIRGAGNKSGIVDEFRKIKKNRDKAKEDYENSIKGAAGEDNVKAKSAAGKLIDLKNQILSIGDSYMRYLGFLGGLSENVSRSYKAKEEDFQLVEYYFDMVQKVNRYWEENGLLETYRRRLLETLRNRIFLEKYDLKKVADKINILCRLLVGKPLSSTDYYKILLERWESILPSEGERGKAASTYLDLIAKDNKGISSSLKEELKSSIIFLFDFSLQIKELVAQKYSPGISLKTQTISDGIFLKGLFDSIWKAYSESEKEIEEVNKELDSVLSLTSPVIKTEGEEEWLYYAISDPSSCPGESDPNLSAKTAYDFGDIRYWIKYCSGATLAGASNPATWATGLPPPIGPIKFPVVYIPITSFSKSWGFIVAGISITGAYIFPWSLFTNYSSQHESPVVNPAGALKKEVDRIKKEVASLVEVFRFKGVKPFLDSKKAEIDKIDAGIKALQERRSKKRDEKPKRDRELPRVKSIAKWTLETAKWKEEMTLIGEQILQEKRKKFTEALLWKKAYDVLSGGKIPPSEDPVLEGLRKQEEIIDGRLKTLDSLPPKITSLLSPLPTTMQPMTTNFGFTPKNPKPIIEVEDNIDDIINERILNGIIDSFKIPSPDSFLSTNFSPVLENSFANPEAFKKKLKAALPAIKKADPFPKYENLDVKNLQWIRFLTTAWTPIGGRTYGIPGFP